ncbi:MAG: hypothetical protein LCI00_04475 [Chloroflexi bacterium]|nr:hypothetical protein [Chloroflexota bacterium]MCC6894109.1 hypothetical protein [Anaerolineae bacterium]
MSIYQYPLKLRFKLVALAPRIIVTDANGNEVLFISQKVFKLKEDVRIYRDQSKQEEVFHINAEQILDFNTRYNFYQSGNERHLGSVKAKGWRSIWRATYNVDDPAGQQTHFIKEDNPWVKVLDVLFQEIPFLGIFAGYFLHPSYSAYRGGNYEDESKPVMRIQKEPAFFESSYSMELLNPEIDPTEEARVLLSFMLMVQFMRRRG